MSQIEHPSPTALRRFSSLGELPADLLESLSQRLQVQKAARGTRLLERGSRDPSMLYLLHGDIELRAADGGRRRIGHQDPSAATPIARLRPSRYEVIAASPISYLRIDSDLLDEVDSSLELTSTLLVDTYQVEEDTEVSELDVENQLTLQIYEDLNSNQLLLPSLPDIAIRVGQAVNDDYADANRVAKVVENDPIIAAKLLKVANSPVHAGLGKVNTLAEAIVRVGLNNVHQLVITFALRELFRCKSPELKQRMQSIWEHSRKVTAIAHTLAGHCPTLNQDTALLAGLLHDVGSVAVLGYARDFPDIVSHPMMLDASLAHLRGQLGNMILQNWQLSPELAGVAANAENWQRSHEGHCDYSDVVCLARLHALLESDSRQNLPQPEQLPAYAQLGFGEDSPLSSTELLAGAQADIEQTLSLLGP